IPMVLFTIVAMVVYFRRYLRLSLSHYLRRSCIWPVVIQGPFIIGILLLANYYPPPSLLVLFSEIAIATIPYSILAVAVCVSSSERRAFLKVAEKFGVRLTPRYS
ncbi:MAG TPA: hypothetical protein VJX67_03170, partial [Blastocatellia bacterium]|nr:hypothetical protein [Blastocatellia bacterium]